MVERTIRRVIHHWLVNVDNAGIEMLLERSQPSGFKLIVPLGGNVEVGRLRAVAGMIDHGG